MGISLIHGLLEATIFEAIELKHDYDQIHGNGNGNGFLTKICTCCFLPEVEDLFMLMGLKRRNHLYATLDFDNARIARTCVIQDDSFNPAWKETFHVYCAYEAEHIIVSVKDQLQVAGAEVVGKALIPVRNLLSADGIEGWFDLISYTGVLSKHSHGKIRLSLKFTQARDDSYWGAGVRSIVDKGVPFTFYKQTSGNQIRLYQDAHSSDSFRPEIRLKGGQLYQPTHCWEDIYEALMGAKHFIYIAGWSVYTQITLLRDHDRMIAGGEGLTLGKLLKEKAEEGVRVLMLVWDDRTSWGVLKRNGLMQTHDEDTESYFQDSKVHCMLCPRNPDDGSTILHGFEVGLSFTHHQKTITVDVVGGSSNDQEKRQIVSFVGGIDLCDGRYDTQEHSLFRTLNQIAHAHDFHQANFGKASLALGGPRQPWHDVHSRLEGPVAWDVLFNFEQRWKRQGKKGLLYPTLQNLLQLVITDNDRKNAWNAQLFRSIDEGAVAGFPKDPDIASFMGLVKGKENTIDRSLQDGYIHAIRRAQRFIYMENQYFIGGSPSWSSQHDAEALQIVPMELTLKIISKIESGERFAVYVVIPMWPEGEPESGSVQAILRWQRLTMEMMYRRIAEALRKKGSKESPCDYLNFFCLGNRERKQDGEYMPHTVPVPGSNYHRSQESRRFMIYVHAKTMIVDDEYIIVGSANCNQRSMDGARDSEIGIGAYQVQHLAVGEFEAARGQIHGFRMSLWYEHTGRVHDVYLQPERLECVRQMRKWSHERWEKYVGMSIVDLEGHLLPYPISVDDASGQVTDMPGFETFPDTNAPVKGSKSSFLPSFLTV